MNFGKQFKEGLITQNPVLVQLLGMCSTMAITTSFFNGLGMGVSVLIILTLSNIFIALLRKIIPNEVRIACFIVVIAGFVTCVDLLLKAFVPALSNSLGVFIPLIVVNCIILGRAEAFASKNTVGASTVDGICQGIGYTVVLLQVTDQYTDFLAQSGQELEETTGTVKYDFSFTVPDAAVQAVRYDCGSYQTIFAQVDYDCGQTIYMTAAAKTSDYQPIIDLMQNVWPTGATPETAAQVS